MLTQRYQEEPELCKTLVLKKRDSLFSKVFKYTTKPYLLKLGYSLEVKLSKIALQIC